MKTVISILIFTLAFLAYSKAQDNTKVEFALFKSDDHRYRFTVQYSDGRIEDLADKLRLPLKHDEYRPKRIICSDSLYNALIFKCLEYLSGQGFTLQSTNLLGDVGGSGFRWNFTAYREYLFIRKKL